MTQANADTSRPAFEIADLISSVDGTPRMMDLTLANGLEFSRPRDIRKIIERHMESLIRFGEVCATAAQTLNLKEKLGGRPGKAYYLNKKQALYICTKSDTSNATEVTIQMVEVFDAYTAGEMVAIDKPVHVREHDRRTSTKLDDALRLKKNIDRLESVMSTIQPAKPNFCAMVVDGEHVFVDLHDSRLHGERAVVITWDGQVKIMEVNSDFSAMPRFAKQRSALGPEIKTGTGTVRDGVVVIGKVMEARGDDRDRVAPITNRVRSEIVRMLEAGPYSDKQIASHLMCAPSLVKEVRREHSMRLR